MDFPGKDDLMARYHGYADDELLQILRHPTDYQSTAIEAAHEVAEARGIDIPAVQVRDGKRKLSLFPLISSEEKVVKLIKSMQRLLYLIALIPLITAALSFADGYPALAVAYTLIALLWGACALLSVSRRKPTIVWLFFPLVACMLILRYMTAGWPVGLKTTDWLVAAIAFFLLVYLILYFKTLLQTVSRPG